MLVAIDELESCITCLRAISKLAWDDRTICDNAYIVGYFVETRLGDWL